MKTQQQRIEDAAHAMRKASALSISVEWATELATLALDAADREQPTWPTDTSCDFVLGHHSHEGRARMRIAMLADPIILAAIAYRDACDYPRRDTSNMRSTGLTLRAEVKRAGL